MALEQLEVSELTIGKPPLPSLSSTAPLSLALALLKHFHEVSVWDCSGTERGKGGDDSQEGPIPRQPCRCVGKVSMLDLVCFLATDRSLRHPKTALRTPLAALLHNAPDEVQHIEPETSLLDALDMIANGAENLVMPICNRNGMKLTKTACYGTTKCLNAGGSHNGLQYCWITQEDVLRFLIGCIGVFAPLPMMSLESLVGVIRTTAVLTVDAEECADYVGEIVRKAPKVTPIAIVVHKNGDHSNNEPRLVAEISTYALKSCNETAALAMATLSIKDFLTYVSEYRNAPRELLEAMKVRLARKLKAAEEDRKLTDAAFFWSSSDSDISKEDSSEEDEKSSNNRLMNESISYGFTLSMPITCRPRSSLIAVIVQALAHRVNHVWVTQENGTLVGCVTFVDIIVALLDHRSC